MVIEGGCVSIAMYCIIQFYLQTRIDLAEHRPLLKVAAIKLVIFLSFWQNLLISFLTSSGAIKASSTIQTPDIKVGIPAMLLCIEMAIFSVFHLWAFPWQVYDVRRSQIVAAESAPGFFPDPKTAYQGGPLGLKALADAFNPWDIIKNVGRGFRWLWVGRKVRHQDISYKTPSANPNGTGLEPTRNQFTAFNAGTADGSSTPYDRPDNTNPYAGAAVIAGGGSYKKSGHYTPLSDQDEPVWPANAPPSYPLSQGPLPSSSHQQLPPQELGLTGAGRSHSGETHLAPPYPLSPTTTTPSTAEKQRRTPSGSSLTPDTHPLGPPGRKSHEQEEWEQYDGAGKGEDERGLGGGHGVRDNRF